MIVLIWRNFWRLSACIRIKFKSNVFLAILQLQTYYFEYFWHVWLRISKVIQWTCRKLSCLSASKKSTSSPMFIWRYYKDMQTYFGYFGHAWLCKPKVIISPCRYLVFICTPKIHFIIHFFLEILHFKEIYNLIDWQHFRL